MAPSSPTLARWELAVRLRNRRKAAGIDVATITRSVGFTRNYWSAVEHDRALLAEDKLRAVVSLLGFNDHEIDELLALRERARGRGWWNLEVISDDLQRLYGLEHGAERVRTFEGFLITGLLQTADYARALMANSPGIRPIDVEALVDARLKRQERLAGPDPLHLTAVMSHACLLQYVADWELHLVQLRHLAATIEAHPQSVELRVVPFTVPPGGVMGAATFFLLDFPSPSLPTVAWRESIESFGMTDASEAVSHLQLAYQQALDRALGREESLALIEQHIRDLERQRKIL
jgi:transcriptional regulator with XRE-family HTH domain